MAKDRPPRSGDDESDVITCPACQGQAWKPNGDPCPRCNGNGVVTRK